MVIRPPYLRDPLLTALTCCAPVACCGTGGGVRSAKGGQAPRQQGPGGVQGGLGHEVGQWKVHVGAPRAPREREGQARRLHCKGSRRGTINQERQEAEEAQ